MNPVDRRHKPTVSIDPIVYDMVEALRKEKDDEIQDLLQEFDELRQEYVSQVDELRSDYGEEFARIILRLKNLSPGGITDEDK